MRGVGARSKHREHRRASGKVMMSGCAVQSTAYDRYGHHRIYSRLVKALHNLDDVVRATVRKQRSGLGTCGACK